MKIKFNNVVVKMEYIELLNLIQSGAIKQRTKIVLETKNVIWKWNGRTDYSPIVQIFDPIQPIIPFAKITHSS